MPFSMNSLPLPWEKRHEKRTISLKQMNLVIALEDLLLAPARCGTTHVIAIDGRAGAGKTTLANELSLALQMHRNVTLIHLDEIYSGWELALSQTLTDTLSYILDALSNQQTAKIPIFVWHSMEYNSTRDVSPCDVLIIEGVGSAQRVVRDMATACIWIDVDPQSGVERVLERDGRGIEEQMYRWQISEEAHFISDRTRENADFVLSGP